LKKCWSKAKIIYKELNKLNSSSDKRDSKYFRMNMPFSFYYKKNSEFGDEYDPRNP